MKSIVFYAYPPEPDGQSLQGDLLYRGILNTGEDAIPCHFKDSIQKEFYLKHLKPEVAFGIGFWGNVPHVIREPLKHGVRPVPWFNADGWVANYHDEFNALDLMFTTSEWVRSIYKRDGVNVGKIIPMPIGIETDMFKPTNNIRYNKYIRKMFGIATYFCDPYCSWQKGLVENTNMFIRQYLPKNAPIDSISDEEIYEIQEKLNNRPRKCLRYMTPNEYFNSLT